MKVNWLLTIAAVVFLGLGNFAKAQEVQNRTFQISDNTAATTAAESHAHTHEASASLGDCGCEAASCNGGCSTGCDDEPWRLFPKWCNLSLTGWVAAGVTANADNPGSKYNGVTTFNDREDFQLQQLYAVMERKAESNGGLGLGGRVDLLFGSDYIFTQAAGLETTRNFGNKWNSRAQYGLAMPQIYGEAAWGDMSVKLGHFYTIIGYEVVTATGNFFQSHAYTMQYGEPFTHTGGLGEWKYSDRLTVWAGLVNGWDKFDALTNQTAFLGGFKWTPCHEQYSITLTGISGQEDGAVSSSRLTQRHMYSFVFDYNVTDNLEYVFQHDNGWQKGVTGGAAGYEWYGINQYAFYKINDCWKAGARFEWFRDDDGQRVGGIRAGNPNTGSFVGNFYNITLGLNWTPTSNLIVRPEIRWDWFEGSGLPFDDASKDEQFLASMDMILVW